MPAVLASLDVEATVPLADQRSLRAGSCWWPATAAGSRCAAPIAAFVRTRTLEPGERFAMPDRNDLALSTGNAGGLEILLDGQSVGPAGAPGAVVKNLSLAPDALRQRVAATQ